MTQIQINFTTINEGLVQCNNYTITYSPTLINTGLEIICELEEVNRRILLIFYIPILLGDHLRHQGVTFRSFDNKDWI